MSHLYIESDTNPRVKRWKRLAADARAVRREGAALLEGIHLLGVILEHPEIEVHAVILCSGAATEEARELAERLSAQKNACVFLLAGRIYDEISPVENGVGVMCEIAVPAAPDESLWKNADALYLDGVQDAGNVGTLIRSAAAAGVATIVASTSRCAWSRGCPCGAFARSTRGACSPRTRAGARTSSLRTTTRRRARSAG